MIALILTEDLTLFRVARETFEQHEIHCVHVRDVLRLIDQIHEMGPDILLVREKDYPLHLHLVAALLRFSQDLRHCRFLVIGNTSLPWKCAATVSERAFMSDPEQILSLLSLKKQAQYPSANSTRHGSPGSLLVAKASRIIKSSNAL
ncbi:MAG: hypothetical protein N3A02_04155 [Rectinema sp.]|nr:hypothetical protein [Rectinema sp.]